LQQFNVPHIKDDKIINNMTKELLKLASDIEGDKAITVQENKNPSDKKKIDKENGDNNVDGWADE